MKPSPGKNVTASKYSMSASRVEFHSDSGAVTLCAGRVLRRIAAGEFGVASRPIKKSPPNT
eukprot:scaffold65118_cov60-Phaeocystis_antarctica.AAC.3